MDNRADFISLAGLRPDGRRGREIRRVRCRFGVFKVLCAAPNFELTRYNNVALRGTSAIRGTHRNSKAATSPACFAGFTRNVEMHLFDIMKERDITLTGCLVVRFPRAYVSTASDSPLFDKYRCAAVARHHTQNVVDAFMISESATHRADERAIFIVVLPLFHEEGTHCCRASVYLQRWMLC